MTNNRTIASRLRSLLDLVTTIVVLVAASVFFWDTTLRSSRGVPEERLIPVPAEPVSLAGAPSIGSATATVAIVEFADFQCTFCARFAKDILPQIKAKYLDSGKVLFAFKHNPLSQMHSRAEASAHASECAGQQGKFWQFHDRLFDNPRELGEPDFFGYASDAGLDIGVFEQCLTGRQPERVTEDSALAKTLNLTGTPVFLVGRVIQGGRVSVSQVLTGARPPAEFSAVLDRVLKGEPGR
jgi:protein-disulfide isomerase